MTENSVTLDMDETRELKWTFQAIKNFERRSKEILKRLGFKNDRGQFVADTPQNTGSILGNFIKISEFLEAAIAATANVSGLEGKDGKPSDAMCIIQGYLDRGGNIETLEAEIYRAYTGYQGPSALAEHEANLIRDAEIKRINREKSEAMMEAARQELASDQKKIENLKKTSGNTPTE
jgi:hypothetical protein